jgi:hemoglobin
MNMTQEITKADIEQVVHAFYTKVQQDAHLSKPFAHVTDWVRHEQILSHFWWMNLGGERYLNHRYDVTGKHRAHGFTPELLNGHWLPLFEQVVVATLPADLAQVWLVSAHRIGRSLTLMYEQQQLRNAHDAQGFHELRKPLAF